MSTEADTKIWVGFVFPETDHLLPLLEELPEELYDTLSAYGECEIGGLQFKLIYHAEEPIGIGVEVLDQSWSEGPAEFDVAALHLRISELIPQVASALKGIVESKPKVWLATVL